MSVQSEVSASTSVLVNASPERAFEVFTANMGKWWPKSHSLAKSPQQDVIVEPKPGGRWYEVAEDGSECPWGTVLAWDPPHTVQLTWKLNGRWEYDPDFETTVEVTFQSEGDTTRVTLAHHQLERYGDDMEKIRAGLFSDNGWTGILQLFGTSVDA